MRLSQVKFKRIRLKVKRPTVQDLMLILFLVLTVFIPFTKISIPAVGAYELTFGDVTLIILTLITFIYNGKIRKNFVPFFAVLLLFVFVCLCSMVMVRDWMRYFLSIVPFVFALMVSYATLSYFSSGDLKKRFIYFRFVVFISLIISTIPVYLQFFFGIKNNLFYDAYGWRYSFLCQNPNQYGIYFILYFFLITLITIKFFPKDLGKLLLIELLFFIPAFFSGSMSTTIVFTANYIILLIYYIINASVIKKTALISIVAIFMSVFLGSFLETVGESAGQVRRALSIFERVSNIQEFSIAGQTGPTHDDAIYLFKTYPILGVGLGGKYAYTGRGVEIHSTFLLFLAETGAIGFFMFMLMFSLTPIYALFSRDKFQFILLIFILYALFGALNIPAMLFRQRWVWFFLCISFILVNLDKNYKNQSSKLAILN